MPTRVIESAPPLYTYSPDGGIDLRFPRNPDPAALRALAMWLEAARIYGARFGESDRPAAAAARRALAVIWDAATAAAHGRDGTRRSSTFAGRRTRLVGRCGGRHLGRAERRALMSAAAAAYREVCGVDYSDRVVIVSVPRS